MIDIGATVRIALNLDPGPRPDVDPECAGREGAVVDRGVSGDLTETGDYTLIRYVWLDIPDLVRRDPYYPHRFGPFCEEEVEVL
jgi:hypothetical protein